MQKRRIKTDINFLEYPCHVVDNKSIDKKVYKIKTNRGTFTLSSSASNRLPSSKDRIIFYYFIRELAKKDFDIRTIITNRHIVSMEIWGASSGRYNEMIIESLERYKGLTAKFENIFYDGFEYKIKMFGFIDNFHLKKNGSLSVVFNEELINQLKKSEYYRLVNYEEIKKLRSNIAIRLYEYLLKQKFPFKIGVVKLGNKLTLAKSRLYQSVIIKTLNRTLDEVNLKTSLNIDFKYNQTTKIITFFEQNSQ